MSADPDLDLQKAVIAKLRADSAVAALVGAKIYDAVPDSRSYPYISYGADDAISDDYDCEEEKVSGTSPGAIRTYDIRLLLDVWSNAVGQVEGKKIAGAVRRALRGMDQELDDHTLLDLDHRITRYLRDPSGITHVSMEFYAIVEE